MKKMIFMFLFFVSTNGFALTLEKFVRAGVTNGTGNGLAYEEIHVMPTVDSGYRWAFGNFLLGIGGTAGAALPVYLKRTPVGCTEGCLVLPSNAAQRIPVPYAGITLDVGVVF